MQLKEEFTMSGKDLTLVNSCIQDKDLAKLLSLPDCVDDFTEVSIVKCVECFLQTPDADIKKALKLPQSQLKDSLLWMKDGQEAPFVPAKCFALNKMLQQKFSPQFLQEATRMMSFDCVLMLTRYLHFLLHWCPEETGSSRVSPDYEQVIDWLNAVLDSHYQQLYLADDAVPVLDSLKEVIDVMARSQVEMKTLQGMLKELIQQFEEQQKNPKIGNYCIEIVSF